MVIGEDAGLECKTANAFQTDKWKDGKIFATMSSDEFKKRAKK